MLVVLGVYDIENQMCFSNASRSCKNSCMWMFYKHFIFWQNENIRFVLLIFRSRDTVKEAYKTDLKSLIMWASSSRTPDTHNEGKAVYICSAEPPGDLNLDYTSSFFRLN